MKKKTICKVSLGGVLSVVCLAGAIVADVAGARYNGVITRWWAGTFHKTVETNDGDTQLQAQENGAEITETVEEEGAVLLKNNGTLPLDTSHTIALLGYGSYNPKFGGAGSVSQASDYVSNEEVSFYDAFEMAGYSVDTTMKDYYAKYGNNQSTSGQMIGGWSAASGVSDGPIGGDTEAGKALQTALNTAKTKADTAVLSFFRSGAEGSDCSLDVTGQTNCDAGKHYLEFQQNELDLIDFAENNFQNVIVLINSSNVMELGKLNDEKIDAALWIGMPGTTGIQAIADIISGDVTPSGKLPDTYAYDLTTAPSYYGATDGTYSNYDDFASTTYTYNGITYTFNNKVDGGVNYDTEGIYVGYRYYETAATEGYIDYDKTVQYPFGYGLSYTDFDWQIESSKFEDTHGQIEISVKVTNVGKTFGKDVVELYYTAPYYKERKIEKSSKVLGAFAKTKELKPGESDTVKLTMDVDDLASYDYLGEKCYVADEGKYEFNLQTDSHHVKKNADGTTLMTLDYDVSTRRVYKDGGVGKRSSDKVVATNAFDFSSDGDGNINNTIPYVSRSDFANTHPSKTMGKRIDQYTDLKMGEKTIDRMKNTLGGSDYDFSMNEKYVSESKIPVANDEKNNLTVDDLAGYTDYDDEIWDRLVNEMSLEEQALLLEDDGYGTPAIDSIKKKLATDVDGPAGISSANLNFYGNQYTSEPVMAATFNKDLLRQVGEAVAREAKCAGINGWYAPGANTHRTPFNGRNGEYFSEDPLLAGVLATAEVDGAQSKGLYVYLKHFACNDTDNKRGGMYTWINEQELREIQLKVWELPTKRANLLGVMESYNRIGTAETSTCYALNTTVLKNEWGFKGMGLTDGYSPMIGCDKYEHPDIQLRAGCGQLLFTGGYNGEGGFSDNVLKNEKGREMLHDACRRILYRHCNSNAMTVSRDYSPTWIIWLVLVNVLLAAGIALSVIFLIVRPLVKEKKEEK